MATTPYPYGRFIGRVGGLAVALGIGAAIANGSAIAAADDGQSSSSEGSATNARTSSSSAGGATSTSSTSGTNSAHSSSTNHDGDGPKSTNETVTTDPKSTVSSKDDEVSSTNRKKKRASEPESSTDQTAEDTKTVVAETTITKQTVSVGTSAPDPAPPAESVALVSTLGTATREFGRAAASDPAGATTPTAAVQTVAVSPLGTPEQLAAERRAAETVNTLPVLLMKLFLRQGFLSAAQQQFASVGGPDAENLAALNNAVDEYAMAAAFQQQLLNPMTPTVVTQVAPPHTWYGMDVGGSRILYDNPDTIYRFMAVNKTSSYVITGRFTGGVPGDTTFSVLEGLAGTTSSILTAKDLVVAPDGTFTITVSGEPAAPGQTNHIQLTSSSTLIAARNTLADWNTEDPMSLSIERVSGPPNSLFAQLGGFVLLGQLVNNNPLLATLASLIPPLPIAESPLVRGTFTAFILAIRGVSQESKYMALATTDPESGELRQPNEMSEPASNAEFLANQLQSNGYFQLADDQALVLTVDPGNAGYFVVPVYNDWTITDDYWNEQTSLNNAQAIANPDGTYTLVISPTDPGVANWVSTGGLNQGTISIRFQNLDTSSSSVPTVDSQVVSLDQLAAALPATTVYVTPQQRLDQLAARKSGFDNRFAPYPQP